MKKFLTFLLVISIGWWALQTNKSRPVSTEITPQAFFSLDDGNQDQALLYASLSQAGIDSIQQKYPWEQCTADDNRVWAYRNTLFEKAAEKSKADDYQGLWLELNRPQKVLWTFLAFDVDTNSGGIRNFIINQPELALSAAEMWTELGMEDMAQDYQAVLQELTGRSTSLAELKTTLNDPAAPWTEHSNKIVASARAEPLASAAKIEAYYDEAFRKSCYQQVAHYVEQNLDLFIQ